MNSRIILVNIIRWFILLSVQVLLLRNLSFYDLATPFTYILFLLLLPFSTPNLVLYLIAFGTGLTLDAFYDTLGVHTAACVTLVLFLLEAFKLTELSYTLLRCLFSGIFTLFTVILIEFIFYNRKMR